MILRVWKARATADGAVGYARHFETAVRHELERVAGFRGAVLLRRDVDEAVEIVVETRWESLAAIAAFAGDDVEHAVVEPGARAVLSEFDERATHYEIVAGISGSDDPRRGGNIE